MTDTKSLSLRDQVIALRDEMTQVLDDRFTRQDVTFNRLSGWRDQLDTLLSGIRGGAAQNEEEATRGDPMGEGRDSPTAASHEAFPTTKGATMQILTIGRTVHYKLSASDVRAISRRRTDSASIAARMKQEPPAWPAGAQAHIGNPVSEGETVPMVITAVWPHEFGEGIPGVNGQAFLDGNDALWVTSAKEGTEPGMWAWPPRI